MSASSSVEEVIARLERDHAAATARGDYDGCAVVVDDDYSLVEAMTAKPLQIVLRDAWLRRLKAGEFAVAALEDVIVADYGTVAVAIVLFSPAGDADSEDMQLVATDVWRQEPPGGASSNVT